MRTWQARLPFLNGRSPPFMGRPGPKRKGLFGLGALVPGQGDRPAGRRPRNAVPTVQDCRSFCRNGLRTRFTSIFAITF